MGSCSPSVGQSSDQIQFLQAPAFAANIRNARFILPSTCRQSAGHFDRRMADANNCKYVR